jgi:hypothetical protein
MLRLSIAAVILVSGLAIAADAGSESNGSVLNPFTLQPVPVKAPARSLIRTPVIRPVLVRPPYTPPERSPYTPPIRS